MQRLDAATERRDSNAPANLGATTNDEEAYEGLVRPTAECDDGESRRLPHLRDYDIDVTWVLYVRLFALSAVRQGLCNYLTGSGIANEKNVALRAPISVLASFSIILGSYWINFMVIGDRCRSPLVIMFSLLASTLYGAVFVFFSPEEAVLTVLPVMFVLACIGLIWSQRRCFSIVFVTVFAINQVALLLIIHSLQDVQRRLPEEARQFLVPAVKTIYRETFCEVCTALWKKMYSRPCSPYALTGTLLIPVVCTETMGVVGLLAFVDSDNIWIDAAKFCATTIVMETSSRSGILLSFVYRLMGKKYQFTYAGYIIRWAKMWASYFWVCAFSAFVVPAVILGLKVENSNFTFLRWEPWVLVGIYLLQQMATDLIYVYIQHCIRPSPTLSQTAARCFVLGQAIPLSGENQHIGDGGGMQSPEGPKQEEFESVEITVGPWTVTVETLLVFVLFEYSWGIWHDYLCGQFCIYGTFQPSEGRSCNWTAQKI